MGTKVQELLAILDGKGSEKEYAAISELSALSGEKFSCHLLEFYKVSSKRNIRATCVYFCFDLAKTSADAKKLGLLALADKSQLVRYRACQLLAFSQDKSLLKAMELARENISKNSISDLDAAMDAIASQNQHYFKDRQHTGKIFMCIAKL